MKETPRDYLARTQSAYRPPPWIRALAPMLGDDTAAPTLFRYPCPAGLRDFQQGQLRRLAGRGHSGPLFLSDTQDAIDTAGHEHFGVLVILDPLRYNPCPLTDPSRPHHWVGENRDISSDPNIVYLPPQLSTHDWDAISNPAQAIEALGGLQLYDEALRHTWDGLTRYLEELSAMARAGAPGPRGPWCAVPEDERLAQLERAGVDPLWSGLEP